RKSRADHFTSPVIAELLARRHLIDWKKLTPAQTIKMASDMAIRHAMSRETLADLHDSFDRYEGKIHALVAGDDAALRTLADKVLTMAPCNMTKAGVDALHFCLEGGDATLGVAFDTPVWQEIRAKVAAR